MEGIEAVELPCFAVKDTIDFHLPKSFNNGKTTWYREGFTQAYTSESGSQLVIICDFKHDVPALSGKQYIVTSQSDRRREGKMNKTDFLWREEDAFGFIVYYSNVTENEKELFDSIIDEIIVQVKKE
ncbi:hypothetical protein I2I11_20510 [Pontibacter sp. 172403-2]|uniref:hypothetical protein n=1 Tax=Pontibacter rufus TaxID=2791028 RepID=UPI0018AFCB19|nr:hypothetical protein [Pontibacter sp. 172403-2]MBF9255692.1 hypothetical protein [Pontibacter sp. 172403-2]